MRTRGNGWRGGLGLSLVLVGCAGSRPDAVRPPPPAGAPLAQGWQWPAAAFAAPDLAAFGVQGLPVQLASLEAFVPGIQRPFDASALRQGGSAGGCRPLEIGAGQFLMPTCGAFPLLGNSPVVASRPMGLRASAPPAVDLRAQGLDGPVKDQQQVGVCWAFALSTIMENGVRRKGGSELVAPLHLVATDAFDDLWRRGSTDGPMTLEASWPYDPAKACKLKSNDDAWCERAYHVEQGSWQRDPVLVSEVDRANRAGVVAVTKVEKVAPSFDALADVIAGGQSAYLSFRIDNASWHGLRVDSVADYAVEDGGRHAVVAMGYRTAGPRGREILIHNSWGPGWGARGYAWVSEDTLARHAVEAFTVEVSSSGVPNPSVSSGGLALPLGLPSIPGVPALGLPGLGAPTGGGSPAPTNACPAGQAKDLLSGACVATCANGLPPAGGACMPF